MDYPVVIEGFEDHEIILRSSPWGAASTLLLDGETAPAGPRRNQYLLTRPDGAEVLVKFRSSFFDSMPQLIVDGKVINAAPLLTWPVTVWCMLPLVLLIIPGSFLDGLMLGFAGAWINTRMFRTEWTTTQKWLATAFVTLACGALYLLLSGRMKDLINTVGTGLGIGPG
jgi:hypothetical protein